MYVRLGFSVAINVDPDILLVDEVLAVGDEEFQRKCAREVRRAQAQRQDDRDRLPRLGAVRNLCDEVGVPRARQAARRSGEAGEVIDGYLADVHVDRVQDGEYGPGGAPVKERSSGSSCSVPTARRRHASTPERRVTIRLHYDTSEPIPQPVFGVAIQTLEGFTVTGPNTRQAGVDFRIS